MSIKVSEIRSGTLCDIHPIVPLSGNGDGVNFIHGHLLCSAIWRKESEKQIHGKMKRFTTRDRSNFHVTRSMNFPAILNPKLNRYRNNHLD
jgi:hypothetical protein